MNAPLPRALMFDVFGTLVDWRRGVAREAERLLGGARPGFDAPAFADAWRDRYQPSMEAVRTGALPFSRLDVLHRHNLDVVLAQRGLGDVDEPTRRELNLAWHRLDAWPDVPSGIERLRTRCLVAPCSNGNISLMVDLARRNGLHWDAVLGAELSGDYKPKAKVYVDAAEALGCAPGEVMMVAAHASDLAAAAAAGLRTAFVARPEEHGPGTGEARPLGPVDLAVSSLLELADRLSA